MEIFKNICYVCKSQRSWCIYTNLRVFPVRTGTVAGVGSGREEPVRRICYFPLFNSAIFGLLFNPQKDIFT